MKTDDRTTMRPTQQAYHKGSTMETPYDRNIGFYVHGAIARAEAAFTPTSEMSERRLKICYDCPIGGLIPRQNGGHNCYYCGCWVEEKTKLAHHKCPENFWLEELK